MTTTMMTVVGLTSDLSGDKPPTRPGTMAATGESDDPLATTVPPPSSRDDGPCDGRRQTTTMTMTTVSG